MIVDVEIALSHQENLIVNRRIIKFLRTQEDSYIFRWLTRNVDPAKAVADDFLGKKAEVVAASWLRSQGELVKLDWEPREGRNKGWHPDLESLTNSGVIYHVKSCNKITKDIVGEESWTFQLSDPLFRQGGVEKIIFVYLDSPTASFGRVQAIATWEEVFPRLRLPTIVIHQKAKRCINLSDLIKEESYARNSHNECTQAFR